MSLATPSLGADDLLTHAERLVQASIEPTDVTDIDLRRSISACYDALFHAITSRVAAHLLPDADDLGRARLVRSIITPFGASPTGSHVARRLRPT